MKLDAHQHLWEPLRGDYGWIPEKDLILNRSYGPEDLQPSLITNGIDGTLLVQAAASLHETEYLLGLADATPFIKGVVGWIDFENPRHHEQLVRLARHPKFKGVRPMIQDIADVNWMLRDDIQWAFEAIVDLDLTFDALGFPRHIQNFHTIANRYPSMRIVYDHCLKPQIRDQRKGIDSYTDWAEGITMLASKPNSCCKLSGLITEADAGFTIEDVRPFSDHVLQAFGADRVMWGSDWPVCRLQLEYKDWFRMAMDLTSYLSEQQQDQIFGSTAKRFYRL